MYRRLGCTPDSRKYRNPSSSEYLSSSCGGIERFATSPAARVANSCRSLLTPGSLSSRLLKVDEDNRSVSSLNCVAFGGSFNFDCLAAGERVANKVGFSRGI